jgi:hypothetical protein
VERDLARRRVLAQISADRHPDQDDTQFVGLDQDMGTLAGLMGRDLGEVVR